MSSVILRYTRLRDRQKWRWGYINRHTRSYIWNACTSGIRIKNMHLCTARNYSIHRTGFQVQVLNLVCCRVFYFNKTPAPNAISCLKKGKGWRMCICTEHCVLIPNSKPIFNIELPPYSLAIPIQNPSPRNTCQRDESKETVSPPEAKSLVHLRSSQWQHGAHDATYQCIGCQSARSIGGKGVYQVR